MEVKGYKAFQKNLINRYGMSFEEGKTYEIDGNLRFGNDGNGFHFCKRLEDTLRYFPGMEEEIDIALVTALGDIEEAEDDYNGYYDMYCTNRLRIDKKLTRKEIIEMFLNNNEMRVIRFLQGFRLYPNEIELFKMRYIDNYRILDAISYYQEGLLDTYEKRYKR